MTQFIVFISNSAADISLVQRLRSQLRASGIEVWADTFNLAPGTVWDKATQAALQKSEFFIILLGKDELSPWVRFELDRAREKMSQDDQFHMLPILLPGFPAKDISGLSPMMALDLRHVSTSIEIASAAVATYIQLGIRETKETQPEVWLDGGSQGRSDFLIARRALSQGARGNRQSGLSRPSHEQHHPRVPELPISSRERQQARLVRTLNAALTFGDMEAEIDNHEAATNWYALAGTLRASLPLQIQPSLGAVFLRLSNAQAHASQREEAVKNLRFALGSMGTDFDNLDGRMGPLLERSGLFLESIGNIALAEDAYVRALAVHQRLHGTRHLTVAQSHANLGRILAMRGNLPEAADHLAQALKIFEEHFGSEPAQASSVLNDLGHVSAAIGEHEKALSLYMRALDLDKRMHGPDHPRVAIRLNNLANLMADMGDLQGAIDLHIRAIEIDERAFGSNHPSVATSMSNLGSVLERANNLSGAKVQYERALEIDERSLGLTHPNVAIRCNNLASVCKSLGDEEAARRLLGRALRILHDSFGEAPPPSIAVARNLASLEEKSHEGFKT